jgi:hypothetical protein
MVNTLSSMLTCQQRHACTVPKPSLSRAYKASSQPLFLTKNAVLREITCLSSMRKGGDFYFNFY